MCASCQPYNPMPVLVKLPSLSQIYEKTFSFFKKRPCLWQLKIVEAILKGNKDVTCILETGSGKTLTFWMTLLFSSRMQIIVTPLNILGKQNEHSLHKLGISAVTLTGQTATATKYQVFWYYINLFTNL